MSGGSFDYAYMTIDLFAERLGEKLDNKNFLEPKVLAQLRDIKELAQYMALLMKEVEWFYSGDTTDFTFMDRVKKINTRYLNGEIDDTRN